MKRLAALFCVLSLLLAACQPQKAPESTGTSSSEMPEKPSPEDSSAHLQLEEKRQPPAAHAETEQVELSVSNYCSEFTLREVFFFDALFAENLAQGQSYAAQQKQQQSNRQTFLSFTFDFQGVEGEFRLPNLPKLAGVENPAISAIRIDFEEDGRTGTPMFSVITKIETTEVLHPISYRYDPFHQRFAHLDETKELQITEIQSTQELPTYYYNPLGYQPTEENQQLLLLWSCSPLDSFEIVSTWNPESEAKQSQALQGQSVVFYTDRLEKEQAVLLPVPRVPEGTVPFQISYQAEKRPRRHALAFDGTYYLDEGREEEPSLLPSPTYKDWEYADGISEISYRLHTGSEEELRSSEILWLDDNHLLLSLGHDGGISFYKINVTNGMIEPFHHEGGSSIITDIRRVPQGVLVSTERSFYIFDENTFELIDTTGLRSGNAKNPVVSDDLSYLAYWEFIGEQGQIVLQDNQKNESHVIHSQNMSHGGSLVRMPLGFTSDLEHLIYTNHLGGGGGTTTGGGLISLKDKQEESFPFTEEEILAVVPGLDAVLLTREESLTSDQVTYQYHCRSLVPTEENEGCESFIQEYGKAQWANGYPKLDSNLPYGFGMLQKENETFAFVLHSFATGESTVLYETQEPLEPVHDLLEISSISPEAGSLAGVRNNKFGVFQITILQQTR